MFNHLLLYIYIFLKFIGTSMAVRVTSWGRRDVSVVKSTCSLLLLQMTQALLPPPTTGSFLPLVTLFPGNLIASSGLYEYLTLKMVCNIHIHIK